jgi:hypothetical protein
MRKALCAWLLFLPLVGGCGGAAKTDPAVAPKGERAAAADSAKPGASDGPSEKKGAAQPWGTLKGRIVWGGKDLPERGLANIPSTHQDHGFCIKDGKVSEDNATIVDAKTKGVRDVFVWLAGKDKLPVHPSLLSGPQPKATIDQPVCMFIPHALALREGQTLVVKNSAPKLHSFKYGGDPEVNPGNNISIQSGKSAEITDLKADRRPISVQCAIHPWMQAWVRVFDHPYFAVTDAPGNFEIKLAPAGSYQLMIWHSTGWLGGKKGRDGRTIEIPAGGLDLGDIEFPPRAP